MGRDLSESGDGWVYVLMNSAVPNMVKIGQTGGEPDDRAKEISAGTGVLVPYMVAWKEQLR
jgi:hypothetical protein